MLMTFNPAINGWAIFSEASLTACRVMAKRLRDVCALPESEPLWRAGRGFDNSPAIYGWVDGSGIPQVPSGTKENYLPSLTGLGRLGCDIPSHK